MLDALRAWLNGKREYYTGVALFEQLSDNKGLLIVLRKGKTEFTYKRLQEELMSICLRMKAETNKAPAQPAKQNPEPFAPVNNELYEACLKEAHLLYKELMNERALLFASTVSQDYEDINRLDLIQQRSKQAVDLVVKYQRVSQHYDRADYVKLHGKLPTDLNNELPADEYDSLPDHLVKQTLDNLRKNYNKIKKREATAERIALLQKHEVNIKKVEARWLLLKPAQ